MIKYKYAIDPSGTIIKIDSLSKETISRGQNFICISCRKALIPRLGNIRQKHFAHKRPYKCSNETYLHKLAIQLFYQEYVYCLSNNRPFYIEVKQLKICNLKHKELGFKCELIGFTKFDLTKFLKRNLISIRDSNTTFINFNIETTYGHFCKGICKKKYDFFLVEILGKCKIYTYTLTQISEFILNNKETIKHFNISDDSLDPYFKYKYLIAKYYVLDKSVKNCYICKYHKINASLGGTEPPIQCKLFGTKDHSNKASECDHFEPDNYYINSYINQYSSLLDRVTKKKPPIELKE
jgi:competence CoiA-like predicted nuclease